MGLDMYLTGRRTETNGKYLDLDLGNWRKHPNLHGFIVDTFANGVDKCQEIPLTRENLKSIIKAIKAHTLPETTGFFFGKSLPEDDAPTIKTLKEAIDWLGEKDPPYVKTIIYQASW